MPDSAAVLLEILSHGITAILATWLGLTVLVHTARRPAARVFPFLALLLVAWSTAILVERTTSDPAVATALNAVEDVAAYLLPIATLHVALAIATEGRYDALQRGVLVTGYLIAALVSIPAIVDPQLEVRVTPPQLAIPPIPGAVLGWAWIAVRIASFGLALVWVADAYRRHRDDETRRRQLLVTLATIAVGAVGGSIRFLPGPADSDPWIGVMFVAAAMLMAVYAVFAQGLFLGPTVAARAFWRALTVGLGVTAIVALLVAAEQAARRLLGIDLPIVTGLALVAAMALIDPIANAARRILAGGDGDATHDRLLTTLGESMLTSQRPDEAVEPALAQLCRTFEISGARVTDADGAEVVSSGTLTDAGDRLDLPLVTGETTYGVLSFGGKRSGLPYTPREVQLLRQAATYVTSSLRLAGQEEHQARVLDRLSEERRAVASAGYALAEALSDDVAAVIMEP
ncbi:MAG TPA: histidine kinase N-terminal 7TM domain-containing protein, partial [Candidatus Limnocylindria bacterium]|nr:histidine kinase N-terminal 7TM domain-containing protein [Candidatus Limnocylindria bacterium]